MPTPIRMPAFSATMESAKLLSWLVEPGDSIAKGQVLGEVETDKAVATLESPGAGRVLKLLVEPGDADLPVHIELAVLELDGEGEGARRGGATPRELSGRNNETPAPVGEAPSGAQRIGAARQSPSSPAARALARTNRIDLNDIAGTGPGGRVVKEDVERYVAAARTAASELGSDDRTSTIVDRDLSATSDRAGVSNSTRLSMARALVHAKTTVPHFYAEVDIRLDALLDLRREVVRTGSRPPTVTAYLIRAAALTLIDVPQANRYWDAERVIQRTGCNIGCAVALEDKVVVPVIRDAGRQSVAQIAVELGRVTSLARQSGLRQDQFGDASLTISNLGMYGIDRFYPIVNVPEPLMLGVGRAREVAGVFGKLIGIQTVITCTASVDHRVLDGAVVGTFLRSFRERIEDPSQLSGGGTGIE